MAAKDIAGKNGTAMKKDGKAEVSIPRALYKRIEERIKGSEFGTVSDYVAYVLREVLAAEDGQGRKALDSEEEASVKDRLKSLGYMD